MKVVQQPWPAAVMTGPWQQCSSSCGGGWQERALLCAAAPGFLVEPWQCFDQGLMRTPASAPCRFVARLALDFSLLTLLNAMAKQRTLTSPFANYVL